MLTIARLCSFLFFPEMLLKMLLSDVKIFEFASNFLSVSKNERKRKRPNLALKQRKSPTFGAFHFGGGEGS